MTTIKNAQKLESVLRSAGMTAQRYARPPVGKSIYTMSTGQKSDKFRFWLGDAEVTVAVDKNHRQAVLTVHEEERWIEDIVWGPSSMPRTRILNQATFVPDSDRSLVYKFFTISAEDFPHPPVTGTTIQAAFEWEGYRVPMNNSFGRRPYRIGDSAYQVCQHAPETTTAFLVGIDESSHFISQLPELATSVEEAHEILKPEGLGDNYLRQGEWFFVPVTDPLVVEDLDDRLRRLLYRSYRKAAVRGLESLSSHQGITVTAYGGRYAIGPIVDTRKGHHKLLMLDGWHKVMRNTEVVVKQAADPRRHWD